MPDESLPKTFPKNLTIQGKQFVLIPPSQAVKLRICAAGTKDWFYYCTENAKTSAKPGARRHFSLFRGGMHMGEIKGASVHISLKPQAARPGHAKKTEDATFWFNYTTQRYSGDSHWNSVGAQRRTRAELYVEDFVQQMTAVATAAAVPPQATIPPPVTVQPMPTQIKEAVSLNLPAVEDWEELADD